MPSRDHSPMRTRTQPDLETALALPQVRVLDHPLMRDLVTRLRDTGSDRHRFGESAEEITRFLLWDALADTSTTMTEISTYVAGTITAPRLAERVAVVAILRAGLGMAGPVQTLLPETPVYQIGVRRDEASLEPVVYATNLPESLAGVSRVFLLDPMLATGGSACVSLELLRQRFTGPVYFLGLIGAPLGVVRLVQADPAVRIHLAALDGRLNERGYIVPGLGDAGDRMFGTG